MKTLLIALALVLLVSTSVHSLQCYTCQDGNCKVVTTCPASSRFCKTDHSAPTLSRTCADTCTRAHNVHCCSTDLCG